MEEALRASLAIAQSWRLGEERHRGMRDKINSCFRFAVRATPLAKGEIIRRKFYPDATYGGRPPR